jgi:hypothetical protein
MRHLLIISAFISLAAPAHAIYKCESNGRTTYSDETCASKAVKLEVHSGSAPADAEHARRTAAREKAELRRIEGEREKREAREEKERQKLARAETVKRKKCAALALQKKWGEEDAAAASGKSAERAKRNAQRKAEKFEMECGK